VRRQKDLHSMTGEHLQAPHDLGDEHRSQIGRGLGPVKYAILDQLAVAHREDDAGQLAQPRGDQVLLVARCAMPDIEPLTAAANRAAQRRCQRLLQPARLLCTWATKRRSAQRYTQIIIRLIERELPTLVRRHEPFVHGEGLARWNEQALALRAPLPGCEL